mgnify:CR=1 FL=1
MSDNLKTLVIVNPNSANGSTGKNWPSLAELIENNLGTFDFKLTARPGDATEFAREACSRGYEMVVALGGDGTNNEVINGFFDGETMINPQCAFGFICSGTGGDFRKTFGWSNNPVEAVKRLVGRECRAIDVGRFTYVDHKSRKRLGHFINIASFGISGLVDSYINNSSKMLGGKLSFMINTLKAMWDYRNQTVTLTLDDSESQEICINTVAVANGRYFGGGMFMAPQAQPDDGFFDVVIIKGVSKLRMLNNGRHIYNGTHIYMPDVSTARASRVKAVSKEDVLIDIDGEHLGRLDCSFENLHKQVRLKI